MGIGDSVTVVACLAGLMLATPALLTVMNLFFNRITTKAAYRLHRGVVVPFFVGLIPIIFIGIPAALLLSIGSVAQFLGSVAFLFLFTMAFSGMASLARMLGARLGELSRQPENPFLETLIGTFMLTFAIAFPLIGWFVLLPISMVIGLGAILMTFFRSMPRVQVAAS